MSSADIWRSLAFISFLSAIFWSCKPSAQTPIRMFAFLKCEIAGQTPWGPVNVLKVCLTEANINAQPGLLGISCRA